MTDNVNEGEPPGGDESQKAKASGLNNSVLGGFARTTAKRFAEYKTSAKENEGKPGAVATVPTNRHSRHDWLERLFDLFEQYAVEVNKLVDESHLITTCHRPSETPSENPLISPMQGCVSTKYWQLTVRLQADGIAGYLLPMSMEKTFLRDESLFERIFLIESPGDDNAAVWSFDNKPTEFFQLPDLAKRFFGSLIEIARMEDISEFEDVPDQRAVAVPVSTELPPIPSFEVEESTFEDEAKFKDLLNYANNVTSNTVSEHATVDHGAVDPMAHSASPFASLSGEQAIDLAKLEEQAESVRKKNKAGSSDFASKTLDSYALLDFEDAETYYSEYRLTPAPTPAPVPVTESLFTRESIPPQDLDEDRTFESAALLAAAETARLEAERAASHAEALAEVARAEAAFAEAMRLEAEHAELELAEAARAEEARAVEEARAAEEAREAEEAKAAAEAAAEEARVEAARAEEARAEEARAEEARAEAARAEAARAEEARAEEARAEAARAEEARAEEARVEEARAEAARAEEARAEEARVEAARVEEARVEAARVEAARAEAARVEEAKAEEARAAALKVEGDDVTDAAAESKRIEAARVEALIARASAKSPFSDPTFTPVAPVTWDSTPVSWEHKEAVSGNDENARLLNAEKSPELQEQAPQEFPLSASNLRGERIAESGTVVGQPEEEVASIDDTHTAAAPVISRVTMDDVPPNAVHDAAADDLIAAKALDDDDQRTTLTQRAEDMHAYRRDDNLDLLTPGDVELSAQALDVDQNDQAIADALLAVTNNNEAPVIKESLTRRELSSEVQKLAAKLQQTSSDLIDTFSRKAQELSASAAEKRTKPVKISPVTPLSPVAETVPEPFSGEAGPKSTSPASDDGWKVFTPDESPILSRIDDSEPLLSLPADDEFLLSAASDLEPGIVPEAQNTSEYQQGDAQPGVVEGSDSPSVDSSIAQVMSSETTEVDEFNATFMQAQKFASAMSENDSPDEHESARQAELAHARDAEELRAPEAQLAPATEISPAPVVDLDQLTASDEQDLSPVPEVEAILDNVQPQDSIPDETTDHVSHQADEAVSPQAEDVAADLTSPAESPEVAEPTEAERQTAFSETFRRSNQYASKKFHLYSSTSNESADTQPTASDSAGEQEPESAPKSFFESLQSIATRREQNKTNERQETANNSQEISMPKTDEMSVIGAIEMMRHSVERELESVAEVGAHAFQAQDMDTVERAMKRTRRVKEFKDQLLPALEAWNTLGREEV